MLRVEISVNTRKIGDLAITNKGPVGDLGDMCLYRIQDIRGAENGDSADDFPVLGEVSHYHSDGAKKLIELVLDEIDEEEFLE